MVQPDDGLEYYAYMLLYIDDALSISHDLASALWELDKYFKMTFILEPNSDKFSRTMECMLGP